MMPTTREVLRVIQILMGVEEEGDLDAMMVEAKASVATSSNIMIAADLLGARSPTRVVAEIIKNKNMGFIHPPSLSIARPKKRNKRW